MKWRVDDNQSEASLSPLSSGLGVAVAVTSATPAAAATSAAPGSVLADMIAHETNGVLTYSGALAVLNDAALSPMNGIEFASLQSAADSLNVPGGVAASAYVQQIFDDVALGNSANAGFNGGANTALALGNLSATSTRLQLHELIRKWFLGTDLPGVAPAPGQSGAATTYESFALPLFAGGQPNIADVNQGQVGDCWYLAALAETALQDPGLISRLITANGNGSFSVEFQVNGHADYVTVNNQFSAYTGGLEQYDGSQMEFANSTTSLWVPLMEKALAELSEQAGVLTGMDYGSGDNQYYELEAGAGGGVTLLTGQRTQGYAIAGRGAKSTTGLLQLMQHDLAAGMDIMLGTSDEAVSGDLVADHMFAVTAVNATTGVVSLYNPWGANGVGLGMPESFSIAASALASDQADFYAARGATTA